MKEEDDLFFDDELDGDTVDEVDVADLTDIANDAGQNKLSARRRLEQLLEEKQFAENLSDIEDYDC